MPLRPKSTVFLYNYKFDGKYQHFLDKNDSRSIKNAVELPIN